MYICPRYKTCLRRNKCTHGEKHEKRNTCETKTATCPCCTEIKDDINNFRDYLSKNVSLKQ